MLGRRSWLKLLAVPFALPFVKVADFFKPKPKYPHWKNGVFPCTKESYRKAWQQAVRKTEFKAPAEAPRGITYWIENGC